MHTSDSSVARVALVAHRFGTLPPLTQPAIVQQLRHRIFAQGFFPQVPCQEWWRVLGLTDPLIHCPAQPPLTYHLLDGGLVLLLISHYLEVPVASDFAA